MIKIIKKCIDKTEKGWYYKKELRERNIKSYLFIGRIKLVKSRTNRLKTAPITNFFVL